MSHQILMYAVSALIMFVSLPLIFRKVSKNMFYGFVPGRRCPGRMSIGIGPIKELVLRCFSLGWFLSSPVCWFHCLCRTENRT